MKKTTAARIAYSANFTSLIASALEVVVAGTVIVAVLYSIFPFKFD